MDDFFIRFFGDLDGRITGPMRFRLLIEPSMAAFFAFKHGLRDARAGRNPYFWSLMTDPLHRVENLHDGWGGIAKVYISALVIDAIYQLWVLGGVYAGEMLLVAFLLAIFPYLLLRSLVNRVARRSWA
jgi:hypothetical protein